MSTTIFEDDQTIVFQRPAASNVMELGTFIDDLMKVLDQHGVENTYWLMAPVEDVLAKLSEDE